MLLITVIIPTLNEEKHIANSLDFLIRTSSSSVEIIIADGGSTDHTLSITSSYKNVYVLNCQKKGRAHQMNEAVKISKGELLYFVHADVRPPDSWEKDIISALDKNKLLGGYRFKFDSRRPLLKFNSWMTRINILSFRGGDQTIYISRNLFMQLDGYKPWEIMEEYDLIKRATKSGVKFNLIQKDVLVSARKYENNSYLKINLANAIAMLRFRMGVDHRKIKATYNKMIKPLIE